jgi:hypothetical protein
MWVLRFGLLLLAAHYAAARSLAGAGIGVSPLATDGQGTAMPQSPITPQVHEPFDILSYLAPQITLDFEIIVEDFPDASNFVVRQVVRLGPEIHTGLG